MGKLQVRRGNRADLPVLDYGEAGFTQDTKRLYIGNSDGINVKYDPAAETIDYLIFVASSTFGGDTQANGKTGRSLATGTATSTSANQLVDTGASFTTALVGEAIYNSVDDTWAKVTSFVDANTLGISVDIMASGEVYYIASAVNSTNDAFNIADAGFQANIIIKVTPESFNGTDLTLIGKTAGGAKTLTFQGSTTGTTTIDQEVSISQKIFLRNITFTKRIFENFGADVDWTTCVTSGDDGFIIVKSDSIANTFRSSSNVVFESDPKKYTNIASTVTQDYTLYVSTSALGGDDSVADGFKITQGSATSTTSNKLVDSTANFNEADHLDKSVYNSTDDTWAKISAVDSTTTVSLSVDIMASGEDYIIANAFSTIQEATNNVPGAINCNTTIKVSNGTFSEDLLTKGKSFTGTYTLFYVGTLTEELSAAQTSSLIGTGSTQGYIGDTVNDVSSYAGYFLYSSNNDEYRVIDSATTDIMTIAGTWPLTPSGDYAIYSSATILSGTTTGLTVLDGQKGVDVTGFEIETATTDSVFATVFSVVVFNICKFNNRLRVTETSSILLNYCYEDFTGPSSQAIRASKYAQVTTNGTKILMGISNKQGIKADVLSSISFLQGSILEGLSSTGTGINAETGTVVNFFSTAAQGLPRMTSWAIGVNVKTGSQAIYTVGTSLIYTSCTTDRQEDTAKSAHYNDTN